MREEIGSLSGLDYDLPGELIAQEPCPERTASRLLHVTPSGFEDRVFRDLGSLLAPGDLLVLNDTKVIPARIPAMKESGGGAEILIERLEGERTVVAQIGASRSPSPGSVLRLQPGSAKVRVVRRRGEFFELEFPGKVSEILSRYGQTPLPPYVRREADAQDLARYQTVYAKREGAVAAPTAGLHFDEALLSDLASQGVGVCTLTLHIGAGTFRPLREEDLSCGRLHSEWVSVPQETMRAVSETRARGGRVVAVGTTVIRALETAVSKDPELGFEGETDLFIRPGYAFRAVDVLLTNFHLPRSSLLALVFAFGGVQRMRAAYEHAIARKYRFYSYGDAMLIRGANTGR